MAKDKKSAAQKAAEQAAAKQAPEVENPQTEQKEDISLAKIATLAKNNTLSQDSKAITANLIQKRWVEDPQAPQAIKDGAGVLVDAFLGDIIVTEMVEGNDTFSMIIRGDEQRYLAVKGMLAAQGITVPEFKELPAPTEEQLAKAGMKALPGPSRVVTVTADNVSKEAKDKKKKEKAIEKTNPTTNPAEIKDEKQLAASLSNLLTKGSENVGVRIKTVINFYRGYLTIQANNSENKEEELKKVKEMSRSEMLNQIAEIVGPCPFALDGAGKLFRNHLVRTGTPIASFCLYRRTAAKNEKDSVDDSFAADVIKTVIIWSCNSAIADAKKSISEAERLIKKNNEEMESKKGDKSAVALCKTAIRFNEDNIKKQNGIIEEMSNTIKMMINPSTSPVDTLIEDYNLEDDTKEEYKRAHLIVDNIMKTYYPGTDLTKVDKDSLLSNVQQRAGIIINMFRDPLSQSIAYSISNLTEITEKKEESEEESKN